MSCVPGCLGRKCPIKRFYESLDKVGMHSCVKIQLRALKRSCLTSS